MKPKNKFFIAVASFFTVALTLTLVPRFVKNITVKGDEPSYSITLDASDKFTSAEQSAHQFTRKTALGNDVVFVTNSVASRSESEYFCQISPGTTSWLRNSDPINGITSITITHDLKLDNCKYSVSGGYTYDNYFDTKTYAPGAHKSNETLKFVFEKPVNYFSINNLYADAGTYIRTLVIEFSCTPGAPEQVVRNNIVIDETKGITAGPTTFEPFYADEWVGKFFYMEYQIDGGTTHSDYVAFSLQNNDGGWKNISGEIDIFGDEKPNKNGIIKSLGDGWYSLAIQATSFNGDGSNRSRINLIYFGKLQNVNSITVDLNSISFRDIEYEYTSSSTDFVKFENPLENWKTSGRKLVIDFEPTQANPDGTKEVMSMKTAGGVKVATFTLRVKTHKLQQGDNGIEIPGAVVQKSGNIWEATINFNDIDCLSGCDGTETVSTISFDRIWCNFKTYKVDYVVNNGSEYEKTNVLTMTDDNFKVVNFTDIHITSLNSLAEGSTVRKTIVYAVEHANPDAITFTGDFIHMSSDFSLIDALCEFMDGFEIPYFFTFGNHDREYQTPASIASRIARSAYGYIDLGPDNLESTGNYTIEIKNSSGDLVHGLVMMDTRNKYDIDASLVQYVTSPVSGVKYGSYNGRNTYCYSGWDGIRGPQIDWYEDTIESMNCETTLMCHAPLLQYCKAYEQYMIALSSGDQSALAACAPVGNCNMGEACCGLLNDFGLFDLIKNLGSTKNVICGHDHTNDFSLMYEGIRLTYSLKTGDGAYWQNDGSRSGYTELNIDDEGHALVNQVYYNPIA